MTDHPVFDAMKARFSAGLKTRILAFGSSNTARTYPGMHWFDVLDVAIAKHHGRIHHCINTGIGGHTARDLLDRFEDDAAFYQPHLALITIGGNDSSPKREVPEEQFAANLTALHRRFARMGTAVVFQTYYAPIDESCDPQHMPRFYRYMDLIRQVAGTTQAGLIDHLVRWQYLKAHHRARFLPLMQDGLHLNRRGNMVMGLDIARSFGVSPAIPYAASAHDPEGRTFWDEAVEIQKLMDERPHD